jgi:phosphohistidine phosphatase
MKKGSSYRDRSPGGAVRTLWLLRHAKAARGSGVADFDRPLEPRGRDAARRIGRHLAESGAHPDLVLCSSAQRTRETLDGVAEAFDEPWVVLEERELYLASEGELLRRLQAVPEDARSVLMVGHNPGVAELAGILATSGPAEDLAQLRRKYPTGALVELRLHAGPWRQLPRGCELVQFVTPKSLGAD